jgi:hypothetical protein
MGIGAGILIAAVGAVLAFAVTAEIAGVDVQTIGVIMLIAGLAIALIAAIATTANRRRVVEYDDGTVGRRRVVTDDAAPPDGARI